MSMNGDGGDVFVDEEARRAATMALQTARGAYEAVGRVLGEVHALRGEVHDGFARLDQRLNGSDPPPPMPLSMAEGAVEGSEASEHPWGRRAYDPEEEITSSGRRAKMPLATLRRMQADLARLTSREKQAAERQKGADLLVKRWKSRLKVAILLGGPTLTGLGWLLHFLWHLLTTGALK